jgi:phosphoribosylglycinamide formyltransferase 1
MRTRVGVLISGNGSTLQAVLDCGDLSDVVVVISSSDKAYGINRARRAGVPVVILPKELRTSEKRAAAEDWILNHLSERRVQTVVLAGYMKIVSANFIEKYKNNIFNIHPSLLPAYKGLDALGEALKSGEPRAGVTVHHVAAEVDSGEFVLQREFDIPLHRDNSLTHLWLHIQEQRVLRESIRKIVWLARAT